MENIKRVQLSEIAELITKGTTPTTLGYEFQEDGVNFLKIECLDENGGFIESKVAHISEECNEKLKRSQLKVGDVLFSIAGAIGRVAIVTEEMLPANTNQALAIIRIADEQVYLPYIKLILTSPIVIEQFEKKKQGVAQLNLSLKDINEISIPLPSKEKQIELAELFDKVDGVIAKRKTEISALDDLIKARFVEMFGDPIQNPKGWDMSLIEDVVANEKNALKAGPFGSALKKEYYVESGYKIYGQEQVISGDHTFGDYYIDEERYKLLENCAVQAGDVLISLVGTYGKLLIMPEVFEPGIINPRLMKITFDKEKVNPHYFKFFFQSESLKKALSENTHGGTMDILNLGIVRKITMPLPPLELQNEFVSFVHQVDKSKFAVQKALDKTQLLFDSLMQKYFG